MTHCVLSHTFAAMSEPLTTSSLCKSVGVTRGQLRLYEREGLLLEPARTGAGYRHYTPDTPNRLNAIKQLKEIGFTLAEISALLAERDIGEIDEARLQATAQSLATTIDQRLHVVREFVAAVGNGDMTAMNDPDCQFLVRFLAIGKSQTLPRAKNASRKSARR
jgi:MerR family transcriptional regulator, copper efflux regulator